MSKEQNALIGLENRINWALFKLEFRASDAERQKRRVIKAHKQIQIIKEALKRSEPMKPIKDKENYRCARCAHLVDNHYCSDCGGAVDWSDEK